MKKALITGANSYIGSSFEKYVSEKYRVDDSLKKADFSHFNIVYHAAGIAHADVGNADEATKDEYYKINTDLSIET